MSAHDANDAHDLESVLAGKRFLPDWFGHDEKTLERARAWARRWRLGAVVPSNAPPCLMTLLTGQVCDWGENGSHALCRVPGGDHDVLWMAFTKPFAIQAQPYGINGKDVERLVDICRVHHLALSLDARDSWWNPGATLSVLIYDPQVYRDVVK